MAGFLQREDDELAEAHEINVTPFIDVMLVLLIIFMVAAPLSTVDVAVDLPVSTATPLSVAGPPAGSKREPGVDSRNRRIGSSFSMPITLS